MILSKVALQDIKTSVMLPDAALFDLPEKVLQFGTGVLLRALPDYFIDKANRKGLFNGRIVVVKSTSRGGLDAFHQQDGLYTLCVRGLQDGIQTEENSIQSAISRVINATDDWQEVLAVARDPALQIIFSNTTEVGIQLLKEDIRQQPPLSFPAKLLAVLFERYRHPGRNAATGLVIIPTELIPDNGNKLKAIVKELARYNGLDNDFMLWLDRENKFCNSLVDRIVPGKPDSVLHQKLEAELGYEDELMILAEVYNLWAIEGDEHVKQVLSFSQADAGVVIVPDIELFRELKLRLLNGTHTCSCGIAFLSGCETVKQSMEDPLISAYIERLLQREIAAAIPYPVEEQVSIDYGNQVLERFRNPHLRHKWINITLQYSMKMKMRCIPVLLEHDRKRHTAPPLMVLGFAAYLYFLRSVVCDNGKYYGLLDGKKYLVQDERAEIFYHWWQTHTPDELVKTVLQDKSWWEADLSVLPGFAAAVTAALYQVMNSGMRTALKITLDKKVITV